MSLADSAFKLREMAKETPELSDALLGVAKELQRLDEAFRVLLDGDEEKYPDGSFVFEPCPACSKRHDLFDPCPT